MQSDCIKLVLLLALLTGCSSAPTLDLGTGWEPLEQIVESPTLAAGLSESGARTIEDTIYVQNLSVWLQRHVGPAFVGVLKHERVHAVRQIDMGVWKWIRKYLVDTDFMWKEEQLGWYEFFIYVKSTGAGIDAVAAAKTLSNYENLSGPMVSYGEALVWVNAVLAGTWHPQ